MALILYAHPFSSYSQKVLIALYKNAMPFALHMLSPDQPQHGAALARHWPPAQFPLLLDGGDPIMESSTIIEHLQIHHPGPVRLLPDDSAAALKVWMLDRIFDNHVMATMQKIVGDARRPEGRRDPVGVEEAKAALDTIYAWLDRHMTGRIWAAGGFSLADCAAAPSLFYADWVSRSPNTCRRSTLTAPACWPAHPLPGP